MWKIIGTIVGTVVVIALGGYAFIRSGVYDVSATPPDSALVAWAAHTASESSVSARFGANVVRAGYDAPALVAEGGQRYLANCAVCHGQPGVEPTAVSIGLNPEPPDLFRATREPDATESFQFVKYGVKMTGMPGFAPSYPDAEI